MAGRAGPGGQVARRDKRPRTRRTTDWSGALVGRWILTCVFISTMRAAILIRRSLSVSNWATRQDEALGISARRLHSRSYDGGRPPALIDEGRPIVMSETPHVLHVRPALAARGTRSARSCRAVRVARAQPIEVARHIAAVRKRADVEAHPARRRRRRPAAPDCRTEGEGPAAGGLDGSSLHRLLEGEGIESWVVDPASVAVSRRMRRAKSDGIDGHTNRIKGLLMSQGMRGYNPLGKNRHACLETLSTPQGRPLPPRMKAEIRRELERLDLLARQIKQVEAERDALAVASPKAVETPAVLLMNLKGVGPETATLLWLEGLFRTFANRRQLAAFAGLAPTPWLSGRIQREQGISKSGNPRLRTAMVELAWLWLRNQPDAALSRWFIEGVRV